MRNLAIYCHVDRHFDRIDAIEHFCVNSLENTVYMYDNGVLYCVSQDDENAIETFCVKERCSEELNSKVVAMSYNSVLGVLCLATEAGVLISVTWSSRRVEVVGSVEQGFRCMQWSPEDEVLLLVTGQNVVMAMTLEFDPLWEQPLHQATFGEQAFITVGWGSKKTQFHGSEGKAAARAVAAPAEKPSPKDDGSIRASWRGDGSLVAVSAVNPETYVRCIRIFSREGVLQATSESVPGLEMALAWRPSGNLIASTQVLPNKYQVVFFEKNGLRHGEFTLPFVPGEGVVRQLSWNAQSDVLSVWYEDSDGAHLLLCTVGNYHWYVKQRFSFPAKQQLRACTWDPEAHLKLHIVYGSIQYATYEWIWTVNHSSVFAQKNRAEVAVIDGKDVLVTAFAEKVVPPPMCAERLQLPSSVNQVLFGPTSYPDKLCAVLSDGRLALFQGSDRSLRWVRNVQVMLESQGGPLVLHHWVWVLDQVLLGVATVGLTSRLVWLQLREQEEDETLKAEVLDVPLEGAVVSVSSVGDGGQGEVIVQTAFGDLLLLQLQLEQWGLVSSEVDLLAGCPEKLVQVHAVQLCDSRVPCVVGLSGRSRLYVDWREVANNVTSLLLLPPDGLLITTTAHTLLYLQLHLLSQGGPTACSLSEAVSRRVERGSRLVITAGERVVLQMPRGNLETITPRALVLKEAAHNLDRGNFAAVFELFRKQRINLNLLVDHNPALFLKHTEEFVRDIKNPAWLSILAVELSEEDTTTTAYADVYRGQPRPEELPWEEGGKRAAICTRLCEAMEAVATADAEAAAAAAAPAGEDAGADAAAAEAEGAGAWAWGRRRAAFHLPRLSALAVGLRDAGAALAALRESAAAAGPARGAAVRDDGLRHLLTLCDAARLFRAALALYDFPLAALVAARANRDPKEYLPFLNELRRLDEAYRRYRVDAYLQRWESALAHLALCPERFQAEFLPLTQERALYAPALALFPPGDPRYAQVAAVYGEYLLKERKLEEAIVMLRRAGRKEDALEASCLAGDWQQALELITELKYTPERRTESLRAVSSVLLQQRRFQEAGQLLFRHCTCVEEAVSALCQGRHWAEARQVAVEATHPDLLEQVKQGIEDHFEQMQSEVASHRNAYEAHLKRLRIVRIQKLNQPEEREGEVGPESDLFSDTSSTSGSGSFQTGRSGSRSGRSTRSGKNRRKQERKLLSLKEGAPYEDLALLRAMHQITTACFALRKEVRALCLALLSARHDADATALQNSLASALQLMEDSRPEVWPPELSSPNALTVPDEQYGPEATVNSIVSGTRKAKVPLQNCELLEPQFRIAPQVQDHLNWKLFVLNV